jgi:5'-nucleotidase
MKRQMIIASDIDDVLLGLVPHWLKPYNKDWNDNLTADKILTWQFSDYVKPECGKKIYDYLTPSLYEGIPIVEGALLGIAALREFARVIFVTSNMGNNGGVKLNKLNQYGFNIDKKDYFEASDKSLIMCDYLLDDSIDNINSTYGQGVLFTQPWNKSSIHTPRVDNWYQAVRYFRKESLKYV